MVRLMLCIKPLKSALMLRLKSPTIKFPIKGEGEDGLGVANLVVNWQQRNFHGYGIATDVIEASGQALVSALNAIYRAQQIQNIRQQKAEQKTA